MAHELNNRQLKFAHGILQGKTQRQAYIDAGYTAKDPDAGASGILSNPKVNQYLTEQREEARTEAVLTLSELQEWWSDVTKGRDPDADFRDRLRASELLGKSMAAFTEKVQQEGGMRIEVAYVEES